jgi:NAD+ synthase (glutamine-hydrolysing)
MVNLNRYGFLRVGVIRPVTAIADVMENLNQIKASLEKVREEMADVLLFPEMSLTSYTIGDLVHHNLIHQSVDCALKNLKEFSVDYPSMFVVGTPLINRGKLYNCAVMLGGGRIVGVVPKSYLPSSDEFYEARWFSSGLGTQNQSVEIAGELVPFGSDLLFQPLNCDLVKISIEICEDLWAIKPPSSDAALAGANLILNPSASNAVVGKAKYRKALILQQSAKTLSSYVYISAGGTESSTDTVYSGYGLIAECGNELSELSDVSLYADYRIIDIDLEKSKFDRSKSVSFKNTPLDLNYREVSFNWPSTRHETKNHLKRYVDKTPFIPKSKEKLNDICKEIINIQTVGLAKRLQHVGTKRAVVGLSGGLDSTLAALVILEAFKFLKDDVSELLAVTMPGFGTSARTKKNAVKLADNLGAKLREVDITQAVSNHLTNIGANEKTTNLTFENSQARERTQILFDYANEQDAILIGTGDLSETALGWCTFAGDHISSYHVNIGVPKTLVRYLIDWYREYRASETLEIVLEDILNTPISPELLPLGKDNEILQLTEDLLGKYEIHDFFLFHFIRYGYSPDKIYLLSQKAFEDKFSNEYLLETMDIFFRRFFTNQFKRSCSPDGPKIGSVALSPRSDWRMPSDASVALWATEIDKLYECL